MTCEFMRLGLQEPKGWSGPQVHPVLQDNYTETAYYESDDDGFTTDTTDTVDTDSDYQSSDDNNTTVKHIQAVRTKSFKVYKIILTDETDYIPE